jgi:hypothetical protein
VDHSPSKQPGQTADEKNLSMEEIEAEDATSLPNKEVLSLLDVNANVDLGLDLAAPVDLAAAANLNVAAPIEASAAANVLSPGAEAASLADQHGAIDQTISGTASATAPQHAEVTQGTGTSGSGTGTADSGAAAPSAGDSASGTAHPATGGAVPTDGASGTAPVQDGATAPAQDGQAPAAQTGGAVPADAGTAVPSADTGTAAGTGATTGDASSLLNGGSLLDANVNIDANANVAAPVDGAVAANANAAAPVDAAVSANVASPDSAAVAEAPQQVDIQQNLDNVNADATANQDANVSQ